MKSVARIAFAFGAAAPLADAHLVHKASSAIEPKLEPETHKEWEKDYPIDVSHRTELGVKYPYPSVQASADYDKDYVKDENNNKMDKKTWDDQLKYAKAVSDAAEDVDKLKNKLDDLKKAADKAKSKEGEEEEELEAAQKKEKELEGKEATKVKQESSGNVTDDVNATADQVDKEMSDLEECKKQLREAKEKLEKLNQEAAEAHEAEEKKEAIKEQAVTVDKDAQQQEEAAEKKLQQEKEALEKAEEHHKEEEKSLEEMEHDLKAAEEKLRSFRGGGSSKETEPARGAASSLAYSALAAATVVLAACA
eukprot:TRINITY_DN1836_c0_g2_i3.p1 TRINITY_DN1836_c0_g2~~TRINITY_DN1836_c0_g2_i3.p1  ORF type:complete len:308 (-),score=148.78 TRINITY_DN1836_c0_g2_i3:165-1088(-)